MDDLSKRLDLLGDAVAQASDQSAQPGALAEARRRFLWYQTRAH
jgi:hypothetical protein